MLTIKLQRRGKKHQPSYRVVVQEKRSKLNGEFIDDLGSYNPKSKISSIKKDRVTYWIQNGAKATSSVHNLLVKNGVIEGKKIPVHKFVVKKKDEVTKEEASKPEEQKEISPSIESSKEEKEPEKVEDKKEETSERKEDATNEPKTDA